MEQQTQPTATCKRCGAVVFDISRPHNCDADAATTRSACVLCGTRTFLMMRGTGTPLCSPCYEERRGGYDLLPDQGYWVGTYTSTSH